jgi:alkylation response protein AidB-like acyl-CoA dehydrogenase
VHTWVRAHLPADITHKVRHAMRLSRDNMQGWPKAFGTPERQQRFLPGIASSKVWWTQGYSEPGSELGARMSSTASLLTKLGLLTSAFR